MFDVLQGGVVSIFWAVIIIFNIDDRVYAKWLRWLTI